MIILSIISQIQIPPTLQSLGQSNLICSLLGKREVSYMILIDSDIFRRRFRLIQIRFRQDSDSLGV